MQSCTFQHNEDPDRYFARLHCLRVQLQQVVCTVDDYQLKVNALLGLPAEYIPMLNQLRTMHSLALTMVNGILREAYANDTLPQKCKKDPLRRYRSEAVMATITAATPPGMKRDMSAAVCRTCKENGHYCQQVPIQAPPSPGYRNGMVFTAQNAHHVQTKSAWLSRQPLSQLHLLL